MPELIIKFNLPEETEDSNITLGASGMHSAIWELKQDLRSKLKHGQYSDKEYNIISEISEFLNKELEDNGVLKLFF